MINEIQGRLTGQQMRFAIVVARFNELVTNQLLKGALDALERHGVSSQDITVVWVPGAFEIPLMAQQLAHPNSVDGVICLGAVIRGATPHFDFVASQAASGVAKVSLDSGLPIIFGVLTTDTLDQALERAGSKAGNKGYEAAVCAIEMVNLMQQTRLQSKNASHFVACELPASS